MKILIIEDNERDVQFVKAALEGEGHIVVHTDNSGDTIVLAANEAYDVIVLDRLLPREVDGLNVLGALRRAGITTPVLILSALANVGERVRGLKAGGDDYLSKPFSFAELLARIEALRRRTWSVDAETTLSVDNLRLDRLSRKAIRGGKEIELHAPEFRFLELLMRHVDQVVTRSMLLEKVWSYDFIPQPNIVDAHVSRLRRKIDAGFDRPLLHTVHNSGYMLSARAYEEH